MRLANYISSPVSQDHFNWLCKAICTRVWARKIGHRLKPTVTPHGIHLITREADHGSTSGVPALAICMAWHVRDASTATRQIEEIIQYSTRFNEPFDTLIIFVSPAISEASLGELHIHSQDRQSPRRIAVSIVSWDEVVGILSQNQVLLKNYVQAGLKNRPDWFSSLPDEVVKKPRLPSRPPSSKKRDRNAPYVNTEFGNFSDYAIAQFRNAIKRSSPPSAVLIPANNHLSMGYAVGTIQKLNVRPFVLVDLWLLTSEIRDVERITSNSHSRSSAANTLHYDTLSWIRFACQDKLKRELVWAFHRNNRNRNRDRATGELLGDASQICVHTVLYDPMSAQSFESCFSQARAQSTTVLSWDDLFPSESQDDCHALAEVSRSFSQLKVTQWKMIGGLEIENEYRISLQQVSVNLARQIQSEHAFDRDIPHSHTVKLDSMEVSHRPNPPLDEISNDPIRLRKRSCQSCASSFLDLNEHPQSVLCAMCERKNAGKR